MEGEDESTELWQAPTKVITNTDLFLTMERCTLVWYSFKGLEYLV